MPDNAINHLRTIRRAAEAGTPLPGDAAGWLVAGAQRYEAGAPLGLTLDRALNLSNVGGAGPWWIAEARRIRDDSLRQLHRTCYAGQPPAEAARLIMRLADRRRRATTGPCGPHETLIDMALRTGVKFPKARRLATILAGC